jgi:hypothetical protein
MSDIENDDQVDLSDSGGVQDSFVKISELLNRFDVQSNEWSNELHGELSNPIKQNLINRLNIHDEGGDFFRTMEEMKRGSNQSEDFEYGQHLLDPGKLDRELFMLVNTLEKTKEKSTTRLEKLKVSFRRVKYAQELVADKIIKRINTDVGLTKTQMKVTDYIAQVEILKNELSIKRDLIRVHNEESEMTAEQLRHKYEQDTENRVVHLIHEIDAKKAKLNKLVEKEGEIKLRTSTLHNDLGTLLHSIEEQERAAKVDTQQAPLHPVVRFRASVYRNAEKQGMTTSLFSGAQALPSTGEITLEAANDSRRALADATDKMHVLVNSISKAEARTASLRKELHQLLHSEHNKALERLKKAVDGMQTKIQSDEQRVKVMAMLVAQMHGTQSASKHQRKYSTAPKKAVSTPMANIRKTLIALAKGGASSAAQQALLHHHRGLLAEEEDDDDQNGGSRVDVMPLLRDLGLGGGASSERESLAMRMHRRLYAQYYVHDAAADSRGAAASVVGSSAGHIVHTTTPDEQDLLPGRHDGAGSSDSDSTAERRHASAGGRVRSGNRGDSKHSKSVKDKIEAQRRVLLSMPRKRRVTTVQSAKIQKIMDMMQRQQVKLSSLKENEVKHILESRVVSMQPNESDRSSFKGGQKNSKELRQAGVVGTVDFSLDIPDDHSSLVSNNGGRSGPGSPRNMSLISNVVGGQAANSVISLDRRSLPVQDPLAGSGGGEGSVTFSDKDGNGSPIPVLSRNASGGSSGSAGRPASALRSTSPSTPRGGQGILSASNKTPVNLSHLRIPTTGALEEENDADFYAENFGIKLALEQLSAIMEVLMNGCLASGSGGSSSGRGSGSGSGGGNGNSNSSAPARSLYREPAGEEDSELQTVEGLRASIQKHIALIREMHFKGLGAKRAKKELQREVDAKLHECDTLRSQLLCEIEGAHWPADTKAGQYELEIQRCKDKLKDLKQLSKQWDHKVSLKRAQNIRLSQIITSDTMRRANQAHAVGKKPVQKKGDIGASKVAADRKSSMIMLDAALDAVDGKVSDINAGVSVFDDISKIYDTAITKIRTVELSNSTSNGTSTDSHLAADSINEAASLAVGAASNMKSPAEPIKQQ